MEALCYYLLVHDPPMTTLKWPSRDSARTCSQAVCGGRQQSCRACSILKNVADQLALARRTLEVAFTNWPQHTKLPRERDATSMPFRCCCTALNQISIAQR